MPRMPVDDAPRENYAGLAAKVFLLPSNRVAPIFRKFADFLSSARGARDYFLLPPPNPRLSPALALFFPATFFLLLSPPNVRAKCRINNNGRNVRLYFSERS